MIAQKITQLDEILSNPSALTKNEASFDKVLHSLYEHQGDPSLKKAMDELRAKHPCIANECTLQGRGYKKKYGYTGDFDIIDRMYTNHVSTEENYSVWDNYFQKQPAPKAVRNRKKYFINKMTSLNTIGSEVKVLNLASGPCRDILELFLWREENSVFHFDCVELDTNAIKYARTLLEEFNTKVKFINKNIYRFIPDGGYDVVWSAGLFDYFDDKIFVKILKRCIDANPHAKIIIGNFSDENPTAPYMEVIGEWFLNYRSPVKLLSLAMEAGADPNKINIEMEPEGVNLFLNIN